MECNGILLKMYRDAYYFLLFTIVLTKVLDIFFIPQAPQKTLELTTENNLIINNLSVLCAFFVTFVVK